MKKEYIIAGAALGAIALFMLPKGESSPSGGGGLGAGAGGLPAIPGIGGGGSDSPTINIDFPEIPPITIPGETKKEVTETNKPFPALTDTLTVMLPEGIEKTYIFDTEGYATNLDKSDPSVGYFDVSTGSFVGYEKTKKEKALTSQEQFPWLFNPFGIFGQKSSGQVLKSEGSMSSKGSETVRAGSTKKIDYAARGYPSAGSSGGISIFGSAIPGGLSPILAAAMKKQGVTSVRY